MKGRLIDWSVTSCHEGWSAGENAKGLQELEDELVLWLVD
jgi:hypothetical protein